MYSKQFVTSSWILAVLTTKLTDVAVMACSLSMKQMKSLRLRSAGSSHLEVVRMVTTELQLRQLRKKVGILVVLKLATHVILWTAFVEKYIEWISPETGLTNFGDSRAVATIHITRRDYMMNISVKNATLENQNLADEHSCVVSQATTLPPMIETLVQVKSSCESILLERTHGNVVQKLVVQVAQDIVNKAHGTPFLIKTANLS